MRRATIRFYGDLAELAAADRAGEVDVPVGLPRSVKDAIESCGVPHTEVDLVLVDGRAVDFTARLGGGERVAAYPWFAALDVPSPVRPAPLAVPRFVADVHLGRLAERLRVLGIDTAYDNGADDADLAAASVTGPRWLLTRDRGLLMRAAVTHGYLVRTHDPEEQAAEVVRRFSLGRALHPGTRCARCNGPLDPVAKADIIHLLEPGTRRDHDVFLRCRSCGRLYWEGSHTPALRDFVARMRAVASDRRGAGKDPGMDDRAIIDHIRELVDQEDALHGPGDPLTDDEAERRRRIEEELDQCYDLLRQRRARRRQGEDPDEAEVRPAAQVEGYVGEEGGPPV